MRAAVTLALRLHVPPAVIYAMSEDDFLLCLAALKLEAEERERRSRADNTLDLLEFDEHG